MQLIIRSPSNSTEWEDYFYFRWQQLRAPWQQPVGSERDEFETVAYHAAVYIENRTICAIGRIHPVDDRFTQIRYMAVAELSQRQGIGTLVLHNLEQTARQWGVKTIRLNARENAKSFYLKLGYQYTGPAETLFNVIRHVAMEKQLD